MYTGHPGIEQDSPSLVAYMSLALPHSKMNDVPKKKIKKKKL